MTAPTTLSFVDKVGGEGDQTRVLNFNRLIANDGQPLLEWRGAIANRGYDMQPTVSATLGKPNSNGVRKISLRCVYPVLEAPNGVNDQGFTAAPKVAYTVETNAVIWVPSRASVAYDTVSQLNMLQAAVTQANVVELIESLLQPV